MNKALSYSVMCWIASSTVGATFVNLFAYFHDGVVTFPRVTFFIITTILLFLGSLIITSPLLGIFIILNSFLTRKISNVLQFKTLLSIFGLVAWVVVSLIGLDFNFSNNLNPVQFWFFLPYLIGLLFGIWGFGIELIKPVSGDINEEDILDAGI